MSKLNGLSILIVMIVFLIGGSLNSVDAQSDWSLQTGTSADDGGRSVAVDSQGNTYVAGITNGNLSTLNNGSSDAFITKYDTDGNIIWSKQLGTGGFDESRSVKVDQNDNVYLTGRTFGTLAENSFGGGDVFAIKYTSAGNEVWSTQIGTSANDQPYDIAVDSFGNTYITGSTTGAIGGANVGGSDAFLMKLNPTGEQIWSKQLGTTLEDTANKILLDANGDVLITGTTRGDLQGTPNGLNDIFVSKYLGGTGTHFYTRQFGTRFNDHASSIALDADGSLYVTGFTEGDFGATSTGGKDAFLLKLDTIGVEVWNRQFGTTEDEEAFSIEVDENGEIVIVGTTDGSLSGTNQGNNDVFAVRYDSSGAEIVRTQYGSDGNDLALNTTIDANGRVVIVGITDGDLHAANAGGLDIFVSRVTAVPEHTSFPIISGVVLYLLSAYRKKRKS